MKILGVHEVVMLQLIVLLYITKQFSSCAMPVEFTGSNLDCNKTNVHLARALCFTTILCGRLASAAFTSYLVGRAWVVVEFIAVSCRIYVCRYFVRFINVEVKTPPKVGEHCVYNTAIFVDYMSTIPQSRSKNYYISPSRHNSVVTMYNLWIVTSDAE